jgi:DNA-binding protein H-NS
LCAERAPATGADLPATPSEAPLIKYRHPVTGETWDGEGPHPQWMRQALLHDGYRVDELRTAPTHEDSHARTVA